MNSDSIILSEYDFFNLMILKPIKKYFAPLKYLLKNLETIFWNYGRKSLNGKILHENILYVIKILTEIWVYYSRKFENYENWNEDQIKEWKKNILVYQNKIQNYEKEIKKHIVYFDFRVFKMRKIISQNDYDILNHYVKILWEI